MSITQMKRPQVVEQAFIDDIRDFLDAAERGEVTDIVIVANLADSRQYFRGSDFQDGWRLLGALEYAKESVLKGMAPQ